MKNLISLFVFSILTLNIVSIETIEAKTKFRFIVGNWVSQNEHVVHADIKINDLRIRHIERIENTDCVKGKQEFLEILGPINPDTHEVVKRLLNSFDKCYDKTGLFIVPTIYLDSGGGYLRDGFKLGRVLKNYKTKTFIVAGAECMSSCATAFLGAKYRYMHSKGKLMFHAPYTIDRISSVTGKVDISCSRNSSDLQDYFIEMLNRVDGEFLYERTMSYCSATSGWFLNADAAKVFNLISQTENWKRELSPYTREFID
jgi:ATP-dependent protease ClpP protease subunit